MTRHDRARTPPTTRTPLSRATARTTLQRKCACEQSGASCERCSKKRLQRQGRDGAAAARRAIPPSVNQVVSSAGHALDAGTRAFMEPRFGYDFSHVRVHTDAGARHSADAVQAHAYTVGHHIVVGQEGGAANRQLMAHELAHVVQQSRGGVPPGIDGEPALERGADHAVSHVARGHAVGAVSGASGVGVARQAKPEASAEPSYEVNFPEGKKILTASEFAAYKVQAAQRLRRRLQLVADFADLGRNSQVDMLKEYHGGVESVWDAVKKPKSLIGIASDIKAGVTPPYLGAWSNAKRSVERGLAALDSGDLAGAARFLSRADQEYREAMSAWNAYREATIGGAEKVASNLETVRDVSFAIALVAGAIVAAPVIAGGVATLGATGALATGATALGTAGVVGTGGAALGGGLAALGSLATTGKVDTKGVTEQAKQWGKTGAVTGLTAGLGSALGGAGKAAELAKPFAQQAARRCLTDAGINVGGEITTQTLDKLLPAAPPPGAAPGEPPKPVVPGPVRAAVTGCIGGALGIPVGKVPGGSKKVADLAVGAGIGYADARAQGQTHDDAVLSALQNAATSAAVGHAEAPKARPAAAPKPAEPHATTTAEPHAPIAPAAARATGAAKESAPPPAAASQPKEATTPTQAGSGKAAADPAQPLADKPATKKGPGATAPAILKEDALATKPTPDGHDVVVTRDGIGRCSPTPCPVIHVEYAKELEANPALKKQNERIQELRNQDPKEAARQAEALVRTLEAERNNQARKAQQPRDALDDAIDRGFGEAQAPGLERRRGRDYLAASEETASARKKTPNEAKPRVDIEDLVPTAEESKEKHPQRAAVRRVKTVLGRTIADHPRLLEHWDAAVAKVTKDQALSKSNYKELYNQTRDEFWTRVKADPEAAAVFGGAGFEFADGKAPLLAVKDPAKVSLEERRVSLDHNIEKRVDWSLALTPSNLTFELQTPNATREITQMRHPEMKSAPPSTQP